VSTAYFFAEFGVDTAVTGLRRATSRRVGPTNAAHAAAPVDDVLPGQYD
jgi:hypothetical protein